MFWSTLEAQSATSSSIETLFVGDNVDFDAIAISDVLDKDDVIQEAKSQHEKLLEYLSREKTMAELIKLITTEPLLDEVQSANESSAMVGGSEDLNAMLEREKHRYKYPNVACEILNCDVPQINAALARSDDLKELLFRFFEMDPAASTSSASRQTYLPSPPNSLNPLLASYVIRVFSLLIWRHTRAMFEFFRSKKPNFVDVLLQHIRLPSVVVLFLHLASASSGDNGMSSGSGGEGLAAAYNMPILLQGCTDNSSDENSLSPLSDDEASSQSSAQQQANELALRDAISQWLDSQQLIEKCISFFDAEAFPEPIFSLNAAQLLCDLVRLSREQQLSRVKKDDMVEDLEPTAYASALLCKIDSDSTFELLAQKLCAGNQHASQAVIVSVINVIESPFEIIPVGWDNEEELRDLLIRFSQRLTSSRIERCVRTLTITVLPTLSTVLHDPPLQYAGVLRLLARVGSDGVVPGEQQAAGGGEPGISSHTVSGAKTTSGGSESSDALYYRQPVGQARVSVVRLVNLFLSFDAPELHDAIGKCQLVRSIIDVGFRNVLSNSFLQREIIQFIRLIAHFERITFFQHQARVQQQHAMQFAPSAPSEGRSHGLSSSSVATEAPRGVFSGSGLVSTLFDQVTGGHGSPSSLHGHGGASSSTAALPSSSSLDASGSGGATSSSLDHSHQYRRNDDELPFLLRQAVVECNLIQRLCDLWRDIDLSLPSVQHQQQQQQQPQARSRNFVPVERGKRRAVRGFLTEIIQELSQPETKHQLICAALRTSTLPQTRSSGSLSGVGAAAAASADAAATGGVGDEQSSDMSDASGSTVNSGELAQQWDTITRTVRDRLEQRPRALGGRHPRDVPGGLDGMASGEAHRIGPGMIMASTAPAVLLLPPPPLGNMHNNNNNNLVHFSSPVDVTMSGAQMPINMPYTVSTALETPPVIPTMSRMLFSGIAPVSLLASSGEEAMLDDAELLAVSKQLESPAFVSRPVRPSGSGAGEVFEDIYAQNAASVAANRTVTFSTPVTENSGGGQDDDVTMAATSNRRRRSAGPHSSPIGAGLISEDSSSSRATTDTDSNSNAADADASNDGSVGDNTNTSDSTRSSTASDSSAATATGSGQQRQPTPVTSTGSGRGAGEVAVETSRDSEHDISSHHDNNMFVVDDENVGEGGGTPAEPTAVGEGAENDAERSVSAASSVALAEELLDDSASSSSSSSLDAVTVTFAVGSSSSGSDQSNPSPTPLSSAIAITKSASAQRHPQHLHHHQHQRQPSGGGSATNVSSGTSGETNKHAGHADDALSTAKKARQQEAAAAAAASSGGRAEGSGSGDFSKQQPLSTSTAAAQHSAAVPSAESSGAENEPRSSHRGHAPGFERQISTIGVPTTGVAADSMRPGGISPSKAEQQQPPTTAVAGEKAETATTSSNGSSDNKDRKPTGTKRLASFFVGPDSFD